MRTVTVFILMLAITAVMSPGTAAQSSAGYELSEHSFNSGGHPSDGVVMSSAGYRITMDAIGDAVLGNGMSSASYRMDGGFTSAYRPPGEIPELWFSDKQTLNWDPEKSVGVYNLYRELLSTLSSLGYGSCEQHDITGETTTDVDSPPGGDGYFYLVTAENRIGEEGTKGKDSDDAERPNDSPCP